MFAGSGIYAPGGPRAYYESTETENGHLLVTELSSHPRLSPDYPAAVNWKLYASSTEQLPSNNRYFSGVVYHDLFFTELTEPKGGCAICQQDLCCHLSYKMAEKQKDDIYVLGAFDGLHVFEGKGFLLLFGQWEGWKILFAAHLHLSHFWLRAIKRRHFLGPSENTCFLHDAF